MTNRKFCLGMLVILLAFGLTVVGCDDGSTDEPTYEEVAIKLPSTTGKFTLTGIPSEYNGKYVILEGFFENSTRVMMGFKDVTKNTADPGYLSTIAGVKIENGSVTIPVYTYSATSSSPASTIQAYTGSDSAYVDLLIYNSAKVSGASINSYIGVVLFGTVSNSIPVTYPVTFSSGNATKTYDSADFIYP